MITKPTILDITAGLILILPLMLLVSVVINSWTFFAGYAAIACVFLYNINGKERYDG